MSCPSLGEKIDGRDGRFVAVAVAVCFVPPEGQVSLRANRRALHRHSVYRIARWLEKARSRFAV